MGKVVANIQQYFMTTNGDERKSNSENTNKSKSVLARNLCLMICRDLLPFSFVSGEGFMDFMQVL